MSDFEEHLATNLFGHEEIDWDEDRVTLRIMASKSFSVDIQAREWGKLLATLTSNIVMKIQTDDDSESRMIEVYDLVAKSYLAEIQTEIAELTAD